MTCTRVEERLWLNSTFSTVRLYRAFVKRRQFFEVVSRMKNVMKKAVGIGQA